MRPTPISPQVFSRMHVCRLFPPSWHQLTLHCGWQGPSAGGPYHTPAPLPQRSDTAYHAIPPPAFPDVHTHLDQDLSANAQPQHQASRQGGTGDGAGARGGQEDGSESGGGGGGGAVAQPPSMISSTWCCNPQFRLTVRKAAEVMVCVAQRDPQVRGHCRSSGGFLWTWAWGSVVPGWS